MTAAKAKVRTAIIPAAGLGTRFLPVTKAIPKEMLPIVDTPAIQIIVEEALAAGIERIIIVTSRGKSAIEDHFDISFELDAILQKRNKLQEAKQVDRIARLAEIITVRQKEPLGLGHAVATAAAVADGEAVAVLLPDDIYDCPGDNATQQLLSLYEARQGAVVALKEVAPGEEKNYGIATGTPTAEGDIRIQDLVEKPDPGTAPSRLAVVGRYILPPTIWPILAGLSPGRGGEYQLTDALRAAARQERGCAGKIVEGTRYDVGDRLGYVQACVAYAMKRPELAASLGSFLSTLATERATRAS